MTIDPAYTGTAILETMKQAVNYNQFLLTRIKAAAHPIEKCASIVDFGAGVGTFAELLRQSDIQVSCIEYDDQLRGNLSNQGYTVYKTADAVASLSIDYIYSLNVLEHIENDDEALRDLYKILTKNGLLYLYVPAFNILYSTMDKKVGHFRRYTHKKLLHQLEKAGFTVISWQYIDSIGFFVSLLYRFIGNSSGEINPTVLKFYDHILFPLSRIADKLLKKVLGKNLEVWAKKNN